MISLKNIEVINFLFIKNITLIITIQCLAESEVYFERDLDLSKEVLWGSVGQIAAKLKVIKVGGFETNSASWPTAN